MRRHLRRTLALLTGAALLAVPAAQAEDSPRLTAELVFPLHPLHNHAPGIVECPNGDLYVTWYRGTGERSADDVAVFGARLKKGRATWDPDQMIMDTPGFPDGNTCLFIDPKGRLWMFWPVILANTWESCLTQFAVSSDYQGEGPPVWEKRGSIFMKPADFGDEAIRVLDEEVKKISAARPLTIEHTQEIAAIRKLLKDKLSQRLGWQPRCKPTLLSTGRLLLPLYSDTYSISIMAVTDDLGETWQASTPLIGFGNIQPAVLEKKDGTVVAYMRENGPRDRIRFASSKDGGLTWSAVTETDLPNPGAGVDAVRLANGNWAIVYNDTTSGRNRLAVSLSEDEGKSWPFTRHLENHETGSYHYPAIIQGADGRIHVVYSYFVKEGKSMKHAAFNEAWLRAQ